MKIRPSIEEVREIASTGKYDVLPLSCEILSDFVRPSGRLSPMQRNSCTASNLK